MYVVCHLHWTQLYDATRHFVKEAEDLPNFIPGSQNLRRRVGHTISDNSLKFLKLRTNKLREILYSTHSRSSENLAPASINSAYLLAGLVTRGSWPVSRMGYSIMCSAVQGTQVPRVGVQEGDSYYERVRESRYPYIVHLADSRLATVSPRIND